MSETILTALISGGITLIVCILNNNAQAKKTEAQHDKTISLIDYRLNELSERVDEHNKVVTRTFILEQNMALQDERLKVANHRIDDLENGK